MILYTVIMFKYFSILFVYYMTNKTLIWAIPVGIVGFGLFVVFFNKITEFKYVHENTEIKFLTEDQLEEKLENTKKNSQNIQNQIIKLFFQM